MPSKSPKQARTMAAHNPAFAKSMGIPQGVARDFNQADAGTGMIRPKPKGKPPRKRRAKVAPVPKKPMTGGMLY